MGKPKLFENKAFEKKSSKKTGFNLAPNTNSFNSIFETTPLDETESNRIEKLLVDNYIPGVIGKEQVERDLNQLKSITSQIRAIGRQGIVLMGERVHKARETLKPYKDGTFTRWLEFTFGTRRTGYNLLAYFELHRDLPRIDLREKFKRMPLRPAYTLASREGEIDLKADIIHKHHKLDHKTLITIIQEKLPHTSESNRVQKQFVERLIAQMTDSVKKIAKRKGVLSKRNKVSLENARKLIESLLS